MDASLNIGDRVKLSGGYEQHPIWRQAGEVTGEIAGFLPDDGRHPRMVVQLDRELCVGAVAGLWVEANLRYTDGEWLDGAIAHLVLHASQPQTATDQPEEGAWIESHAAILAV